MLMGWGGADFVIRRGKGVMGESANRPRLVQVRVGLPRSVGTPGATDPLEKVWTTGFFKDAVDGPVWLSRTGLAGDGQADRQNHGGPDKAINAYAEEHYADWRETLGLPEIGPGGFGENFTTAGMREPDVCVGDIYESGSALIQVSQPRQPCWKLARRWRVKDFVARVQRNGRTGWYFRVLREGEVAAGETLVMVERPYPRWTIAAANEVMYRGKRDRSATLDLAACPALAESWRASLTRRAEALDTA